MIDLSTKLMNASIAWDLAATNADADAAATRAKAVAAKQQSDAGKASRTPQQVASPSYRRSAAGMAAQQAAAWEAKAVALEATAQAHRERADYARRGLLFISKHDARDPGFMHANGELFRECHKEARIVWQGPSSGTKTAEGQPIG